MKNKIIKALSYFLSALIFITSFPIYAEEINNNNFAQTVSFGEGIGKITSTTTKIIDNKVTQKKYTAVNSASGEQVALTLEYKPSCGVLPLVVNSNKIYGGKTMQTMAKHEVSKGNRVIGGINGDFFSMKNGVPIGIMMQEGILKSADPGSSRYAVAFKGSGHAEIVKPDIAITISLNEKTVESSKVRLNKTPFWSEVYILTNEWAATTKTDYNTNEYIAQIKSGNFYPGTDMKLEIKEIRKNVKNGTIPNGCVAIVGKHESLSDAKTGDELTFKIRENSGSLNGIKQIIGGGDLLIKNGKLMTSFDPGISSKNPRTGLGIKADGSVILTVIDGRLPGYSQGLTMKDFAAFMANLGCVDAINFDGGGSSTMVCVPQNSTEEVAAINIPCNSGSLQRSVANGILLVNADTTPHKNKNNFKSVDIYNAAKKCDYNGDDKLQDYELDTLEGISIHGKNIGNISDLYMLPQIKELTLENCNISDISPISSIKNLKTLNLNNNKIFSLSPLKNIVSIENLYIKNNKISDLSEIKELSALKNLDASHNLLENLNGLENKNCLNYVWLNNNQLTDISALKKSTLNYLLDLNSNNLTDISALSDQSKLQRLDAGKNNLNAAVLLSGCKDLARLNLRENNITDLSDTLFTPALKYLDISLNNIPFSYKSKLADLKSGGCNVINEFQGPPSYYRTNERINIWHSGANSSVYINNEKIPGDTDISLSGERYFNILLSGSVTEKTYNLNYRINGTNEECDILKVNNAENATIEKNEVFIYSDNMTDEMQFDFTLSDFADISYFADNNLTVPIENAFSFNEANFIKIFAKVTSDNGKNFKKYKITYKRPDEIINFTDISNHYAKDAVKSVSRLGIVKGYPVNGYLFSFNPDSNSSRSESAAFIMRTLGTDITKFKDYKMIFVDDIEKWAYDYVKSANVLNIANGEAISENTYKFYGQNNVTRVEFIAMLTRAFGFYLDENEEININFKDNNEIPEWGLEYIKVGVKYGLLKGYPEDNTIRAQDYITRGEIAQIIYRIIYSEVF